MLFPVVFWVRVVPGVPGFGAGMMLTKRQAAGRVNLIEDKKRVLHRGSDAGVRGKGSTRLDPLPPFPPPRQAAATRLCWLARRCDGYTGSLGLREPQSVEVGPGLRPRTLGTIPGGSGFRRRGSNRGKGRRTASSHDFCLHYDCSAQNAEVGTRKKGWAGGYGACDHPYRIS